MQLTEYWRARNAREKWLVLATLPLIVLTLIYLLMVEPMARQSTAIVRRAQSLKTSNAKLSEQMKKVRILVRTRSVQSLARRQSTLQGRISAQREKLKQIAAALIPPEKMSAVLQQVLKQRGRLKLISLRNLQPIIIQGKLPDTAKKNPKSVRTQQKNDPGTGVTAPNERALLYRHPLELTFRGNYFDVRNYLASLEKSGFKFYWDGLSYKVIRYPLAEVVLRLSTLGTDPQLMGASDTPVKSETHE